MAEYKRYSRNTSTYVEKIAQIDNLRAQNEKHLHIRGENPLLCLAGVFLRETPPHTWRK